MILQVDVYFFHTWNLLLWRLGNDFLVVLRINFDLVLRVENTLNMVNVSERTQEARGPSAPLEPSPSASGHVRHVSGFSTSWLPLHQRRASGEIFQETMLQARRDSPDVNCWRSSSAWQNYTC